MTEAEKFAEDVGSTVGTALLIIVIVIAVICIAICVCGCMCIFDLGCFKKKPRKPVKEKTEVTVVNAGPAMNPQMQ